MALQEAQVQESHYWIQVLVCYSEQIVCFRLFFLLLQKYKINKILIDILNGNKS